MNKKTLMWALVALVVIAAAILIAGTLTTQKGTPSGQEGPVQVEQTGIVTAIDRDTQTLTLQTGTLTQQDGEFTATERTFTVHWSNSNTAFVAYENLAQLNSGETQPARSGALSPDTTVLVEGEATGNFIEASRITLFPGNARGEEVE